MEKPKEILELENELNCIFKIIKLNEIARYKSEKTFEYSMDDFGNITGIAITYNNLEKIPKTIFENDAHLNYLTSLNLSDNKISEIITLAGFKNLTELNLADNQISDISPLKKLTNIQELWLYLNQISDISPLKELKNIRELNLSENQISDISNLKELKNIQRLYLAKNQISDISNLKELKNIQELYLASNQISNISPLKDLQKLEILTLIYNPIRYLPEWITHFSIEKIYWTDLLPPPNARCVTFYNNPIENVPIEIIKQGKAAIKAWFEEQKKTKSIPNSYVKLILTGNTTVGKTSFINFLTKQSFTEGEITTHGINQINWKPTNTNLEINLWDFGGQEYYHSTHQLFFSNNALYLLMFDKQHNCNGWLQTEIDYADKGQLTEELEHFDYFYWLRNIRNLSGKSKILMLQNKVENIKDRIFPSNEIFDENLEYKVEDYQATSVLNAYNYYKENQKFSYEFEELQKLIISKLNEVKRGEIFEYYLKAKELIETAAQTKPVVSITEFIEICKPANENIANIITDSDGNETEYTAWKLMCVYFHETGVLLYYPDSPTLKEKIFIRPTFVTDTIYKVLNYKVKQAFGRFTFNEAVTSLDNDTVLAQDIIELMSAPNFKMIFNYPQGSENYIAPQYLDDAKPPEKYFNHIVKKMEIGFSLEFANFLPKYILTQFMVNYGRFQKDDIIWKYGIVFEKYGTTTFVEILFDIRKIIYKSDTSGDSVRLKYEVFESLRTINRNDKQLKLGLDTENTYELEKVIRDGALQQFRLFKIGYENYQKHLETERTTTYNKTFLNEYTMENSKYNLKNIFNLLNQSFGDTDLEAFCMFHFATVKNNFGATQFKNQKIMALIDYCTRFDKIEELLNLMETENKVQYEANKPYLKDTINKKTVSPQNANTELLNLLQSEKLFLEKELITTYDSEKKFTLQQQIKELENRILEVNEQKR